MIANYTCKSKNGYKLKRPIQLANSSLENSCLSLKNVLPLSEGTQIKPVMVLFTISYARSFETYWLEVWDMLQVQTWLYLYVKTYIYHNLIDWIKITIHIHIWQLLFYGRDSAGTGKIMRAHQRYGLTSPTVALKDCSETGNCKLARQQLDRKMFVSILMRPRQWQQIVQL